MRDALRFLLVVLIVLPCVVACAGPKGSDIDPQTRRVEPGPSDPAEVNALPAWYPHAVDLRIHPASRYVLEDLDRDGKKQLILEVRVELIDQFGEPTKDVGQFSVEMRLIDANGQMLRLPNGDPLGFNWGFDEFDLTTESEQRKRWDPIARAYMLRLEISDADAELAKNRTVLLVRFDPAWPDLPTLPTGDRARTPVEIRTDW